MDYITLGKIVKTFGIKGEVKVYSSSHFATTRYKKNNQVYLYNESSTERVSFTIRSFHSVHNIDYISFNELSTLNDVQKYVNWLIQIPKEKATLPKDYYHYSDLIGCDILDEHQQTIGQVSAIEEYASYQTLRVKRDSKKDILIPFVKAFIINVDIKAKKIIITPWEGLL